MCLEYIKMWIFLHIFLALYPCIYCASERYTEYWERNMMWMPHYVIANQCYLVGMCINVPNDRITAVPWLKSSMLEQTKNIKI